LVAERPAVERKGVDSINYKLAAGLLADGLACGGPEVHHHYYGPNGEVIEGSGDCGNSPLIGQHLWEINNCRSGLYFAENCAIGISLGEGYDYSDNAIIDGLEVIAPDNNPRFFNPDLRFDPAALGKRAVQLNRKLDQYHGLVLVGEGCSEIRFDDCVFAPTSRTFTGWQDCKASPFYARWLD